MKYIKICTSTALLSLALLAAVTSGSAVAKNCSTAGTGAACGAGHGNVYTGAGKATALNTTLTSGFITVTCTESHITFEVIFPPGIFVVGIHTTNCHDSSGNACTASASASSTNKWEGSTTATGSGNGTATISNVTGQFTCSGVTCKYKKASATTTVDGGEPAKITANVSLEKDEGSSFLCSSTATWTGSYTVTTPSSLWVE